MPSQRTTSAHALLADLPKLHIWGGQPRVGGLNEVIGDRIIAEIEARDAPHVLETGAGATTLLFLCLAPHALTTIAPDAALQQRVLEEAKARGISTDRLRFLCDRSEIALPRLADAHESIDVGLIDGNHGWPAVFVDFCYINRMLRKGGLLFVDDVQLHSVSQLFLLLRHQEEFDLVSLDGKFATFRKVRDHEFLPDWRAEPFIRMSTPMA
jgi:predicted O-methyltransferase YrrM